MTFALETLLLVIATLGVLLTLIGVPGNALPVLIALGYWVGEGGPRFTGTVLLIFVVLFVTGELVEQLAAVAFAKRYGGSKSGMVGAVLGSIVGAILGSMMWPVLGTVLGVFVGTFALTLAFEAVVAGQKVDASLRASWGALLGRAAGVAYKYAAGFAMLGLLAYRFWLAD